ncbi:hypothetical protein O6H91_14G023100 [Diphasiastrum complanatum]|uniref:Uncharacterized protein n=1 Tax=Diphasiastrum complanatum TaxID=34168 RepID=A0ACC2BM90_DIPCM|nr:hypothetical protein O6H91_14G023100 [Diphasiastrum complanatum]
MTEQLVPPVDHTEPATASESTKEAVTEAEHFSPTSVIAPHPVVDSPGSSAAAAEDYHLALTVPNNQAGTLPNTVPDTEAPVSPPSVSSNKAEGGSLDRDVALANLVREKSHSHIRAWEESEKAKSFNKFNKVVAKVTAWENAKKAKAEAHLKTAEETLEKKRAVLVETMMNEIAAAHKLAEEKKANAEAKRAEEFLKAEEIAAKHRASGKQPKKFLCFSS